MKTDAHSLTRLSDPTKNSAAKSSMAPGRRRALMACILSVFVLFSIAFFPGCHPATTSSGDSGAASSPAKLSRVAVTVPPYEWLVRQLVGPEVEVITVVGPGVTPETFQPTDRQVTQIIRSDVLFTIGMPFEKSPWFRNLAESGRVRIVDLREGLPMRHFEPPIWELLQQADLPDERGQQERKEVVEPAATPATPPGSDDLPPAEESPLGRSVHSDAKLHPATRAPESDSALGHSHQPDSAVLSASSEPHEHGPSCSHEGHEHHHHGAGEPDPHIWLSPRLLKMQAARMAQVFAELVPEKAPLFESNLKILEAKLDQLDAELRRTLAPVRGGRFLVYHPAWGYLADEYGLRQIAAEHEGKLPSDHELSALQKFARSCNVKLLLVEPQHAPRAAYLLAESIGARVKSVELLSSELDQALLQAAGAIAEAAF